MLPLVLLCLVDAVVSTDNNLDEKFAILPPHEFIEYFNSQNYSWKMAHYDHLEGQHLARAKVSDKRFPYIHHEPEFFDQLPATFDAREAWPQCESIKKIYNQGHCGSCWTFGTAGTASDRTCIHKNEQVILSEQDLQCCKNCYKGNVCGGGGPYEAFQFWITNGLVSEECKPYNIDNLQLWQDNCKATCQNENIDYDEDKHHGSENYSVTADLNQIKAELFKNGPIEASFKVFADFQKYKGGIYVHKFGSLLGYHSVRVIGYGNENGEDYWLVANSWGEVWGVNGLFKIKAFQDLEFEDALLTGLP